MMCSMNKFGNLEEIKTNEKALNLKKGDVILWGGNMGYPKEELVILNSVNGWEGALNYEVVNLKRSHLEDDYTPYIKKINASDIKEKNDPNIWHSQHYFFTDKKLIENEINDILNFIPIAESRNKKAEEDKIKAIHDSGNLTNSEKRNFTTKEIKKEISKQLKKEFPKCKFSIRTKYNHIDLSLNEAPFKAFRTFEELSDDTILKYMDDGRRTKEQIKELTNQNYSQLNEYSLKEDYDIKNWCNGCFLTEKAHNVLKRAVELLNYYNYDNCDLQTDYFDVNFYTHIEIGRFDKPFKEVA